MLRANLRKFVALGITALTAVVVLFIYSNYRTAHSGYIDILVTPSQASLQIDGHNAKASKNRVGIGNHTVVASMSGFANREQKVSVKPGEIRFVGFVLDPNTSSTKDWYSRHPEDQRLVESITGQELDQTSKDIVKSNPLVTKLPYIGPALDYRIDYGVPSKNSKDGLPGIYIRYRTDQDLQAALKWIKDQGSDPATLDIIYIKGNF